MSWECPECKSQNNDNLAKCFCGYFLVEPDDPIKIRENITKPTWKRSLIEAIIIFIATALPTFIMGLFWGKIGPNDDITFINFKLNFYYISIAVEFIGFTILGCLHRNNRFSHLFSVALILWFFGFFIAPLSIGSIVKMFIHVMSAMLIGGSLSFLFVRPEKAIPNKNDSL